MKKATYTIGAVIILVLAAFSFVFTGSLGGCQALQGESFGSYDGTNIRYEQNSDFVNYIAAYSDYYKNNGINITEENQYYVFKLAFETTVKQLATEKAVKKSHYQSSDFQVNMALKNQFLDKNGSFDKKRYNQTDKMHLESMMQQIKENITRTQYNKDNFGGESFGDFTLYGLKTNENEIAFVKEMNKTLRSFNLASFKMSDYPDSEKIAYAKENIQKFKKYDMDVLTFNSKNEALSTLEKIRKEEITFAEGASLSTRTYSNETGKLRYSYFYQIEPIFKNAEDSKKLESLAKDEVSEPYETTIGYSIFRANQSVTEPDFSNQDDIKTVSTYITQYDFARIQDYFTEKAKSFTEVAKAKGFNSACKQFDITKKELNDLSLNYGNSSLIKSIESQEGLYGLDKNEDFLKKAFSLKENELSEPIIISSSVIVLQFTKQSENQTQIEDSVITNEFVTFDTQSADYAIMNSPKLKNNFDKIYTKIFKRS